MHAFQPTSIWLDANVEADIQLTVNEQGPEPVAAPTKMAQATEVFRRLSRKKGTTRKEIVAAFVEEVGLTAAGAATYYQLIKKRRH